MKKPFKTGVRVAPEFPPKEPLQGVSVRLRVSVWDRLKAIAKAEDRSLNEVVSVFVDWAIQDYERGQASKGKK